jgi:hypothetical protein
MAVRAWVPPVVDLEDEPVFTCWKCWDEPAGWQRIKKCVKDDCGRHKLHAPHFFTVRCPCWLLRNQDRLRLRQGECLQKGWPVPADCVALAELVEGCYRWA